MPDHEPGMKFLLATLALAVGLLAGCGKKQATAHAQGGPTNQTANAASDQGTTVNSTNWQTVLADFGAGKNVSVAGAQTGVNAQIDQAKILVSQTNYPAALKLLQQVSVTKLTPEQQRRVWALKDQIRVSMAANRNGFPR
jgi:hypothetical protein